MRNEVNHLKNIRYRLYTIHGKHYLLDIDERLITILFPFIYWFLPHKAYEIDAVTFHKLKHDPVKDEKSKSKTMSLIAFGGISTILGRYLYNIRHHFEIALGKNESLFIFALAILLLFVARFTLSMRCKEKIQTHINLEQAPIQEMYIFPTSLKYISLTILSILLFVFFGWIGAYAYFEEKSLLFLMIHLLFLALYLLTGGFMISLKHFRVKFRR